MSDLTPPDAVVALAQERQAARERKDFAAADAARDRLRAAGWLVADGPDGFVLTPAPPFPSAPTVAALLADVPDEPREAQRRLGIGVLVDGWPDDTRTCLEALLRHAPADAVLVVLDLGDVDGAGQAAQEIADAAEGRVEVHHVDAGLASTGWAAARTALLRLDPSEFHVVLDLSSVLDGDALGPLVEMLESDPGLVAAGWRGVDVDVADEWRTFVDAAPGECDAVLSYLFVVRRDAALATPPHPKARFYRNADMEWSLALREAGGRIAAGPADLPVHQERHRGYHDSDPQYRDRESRRTYDRLLQRFRGRTELLAPRA